MNHGIYIDASDFRLDVESNDTSYYGLAVGREVGLKYAGVNIKCVNVVMKLAESGKAGTKNRTVWFEYSKLYWIFFKNIQNGVNI